MYKVKTNSYGTIKHVQQDPTRCSRIQLEFGSDYDETFSPFARQESLRRLIAVSTLQRLILHHADVITSFLNRARDAIYMYNPRKRRIFGTWLPAHKVGHTIVCGLPPRKKNGRGREKIVKPTLPEAHWY